MIERKGCQESVTLHDNQQDPYQLKNIAADVPAVVAGLKEELSQWLRHTKDPCMGTYV